MAKTLRKSLFFLVRNPAFTVFRPLANYSKFMQDYATLSGTYRVRFR